MTEAKGPGGTPRGGGRRSRQGSVRPREESRSAEETDGVAGPAPAEGRSGPPICQVAFCPICMAVTTLGDVRPELIEHLLLAGREMLLAMRALIDARLEASPEPGPRLEHVTIQ